MEIRKDKKALDKMYRRRDRFDLQPDYQREEDIWSEEKEQKLMDSILKKWALPKIYFRVIDEENSECVDGQQRLNAIFKFYNNELALSTKFSGSLGGLYYNDLPDKVKDIFDDFELDLELIYNAEDEEIGELFQRLQLGAPLNSAERLNAMSGKMRDFIKKLSEHPFFEEKVPLKNKRYAFQSVCAQISLLEIEGIKNAKFQDLQDFYKRNEAFDENSQKAKKIISVIDLINRIFSSKTFVFKNRASIISFYLLISELVENKFDFKEYMNKLKEFYMTFQQTLKNEIEKGANAQDTELVVYQSKVNQAADSKDSILKRHGILIRRLILFDEFFKDYLTISESENKRLELLKKENIKKLSDDIINLSIEINKIYSSKNGEDLFKITTEGLRGFHRLEEPVESRDNFKELINSIYKVFYEGSGSLNRIPEESKREDSIFLDIKHLRTDFFHDYEHGSEKEIKEKKIIIAEIYNLYTNKKSFEELDENELIHFQRKILEKLKRVLLEIKISV